MEAFSDAVFAIIMTLMVLELKVPHGGQLAVLSSLLPVFLSYVLSFIYLSIYWNKSPSHAKCHAPSERWDPLGQPTPAVLAVVDSFRQWLDGRKSICVRPDSVVWSDSVARRLRLFAAPT
jgi:transmembrane protein TMEM174 (potassium channel)